MAYRATPNAADQVALEVRRTLYDIHLEVDDGREYPRYDAEHRKDHHDFERDLHALARSGRRLFRSLFPSTGARVLGQVLDLENQARGRPAAVQVLDLARSGAPVLWPVVYRATPLRRPGRPPLVSVGRAVRARLGPPWCRPADVPARGPARRPRRTVCPFGFWGLAYEVECMSQDASGLLQSGPADADDLPLTLAVGPRVDEQLLARHREALGAAAFTVDLGRPASGDDLADLLARAPTTVAYLLAHCGNDGVELYLDYGRRVFSGDVWEWATAMRLRNWGDRHPLVVLNSCPRSAVQQRDAGPLRRGVHQRGARRA